MLQALQDKAAVKQEDCKLNKGKRHPQPHGPKRQAAGFSHLTHNAEIKTADFSQEGLWFFTLRNKGANFMLQGLCRTPSVGWTWRRCRGWATEHANLESSETHSVDRSRCWHQRDRREEKP
jgi:hypothetical protein